MSSVTVFSFHPCTARRLERAHRAVGAAVRGQPEDRLPAVLVDQVAGQVVDGDQLGHQRLVGVADDWQRPCTAPMPGSAKCRARPQQHVRVRPVVGVEDHHHLAADEVQRRVQGAGLPAGRAGRPVQHHGPRLGGGEPVQDLAGPVGAVVVDHDQLQLSRRVLQGTERVQEPAQHALLVVAGHQHGQRWRGAEPACRLGRVPVELAGPGGGHHEREVTQEEDDEQRLQAEGRGGHRGRDAERGQRDAQQAEQGERHPRRTQRTAARELRSHRRPTPRSGARPRCAARRWRTGPTGTARSRTPRRSAPGPGSRGSGPAPPMPPGRPGRS